MKAFLSVAILLGLGIPSLVYLWGTQADHDSEIQSDIQAVKEPETVMREQISDWLESSVLEDKTRAYYVLQETGEPEWSGVAVEDLKSEEFYIRINAALYLGKIGDRRAVPVLNEIVGSGRLRKDCKEEARVFLEQLADRGSPKDS
ncbi:MAG: HEAT repeat domain-containing protein [Verrucomicrobiaceae bacterium]